MVIIDHRFNSNGAPTQIIDPHPLFFIPARYGTRSVGSNSFSESFPVKEQRDFMRTVQFATYLILLVLLLLLIWQSRRSISL